MATRTDQLRNVERTIAAAQATLAGLVALRAALMEGEPLTGVDDVEIETASLRKTCAERGIAVTADGRVHLDDAAALLGYSAKTLRNWRHGDDRLSTRKVGGKVTYNLQSLAAFLVSERKKTENF